jgi:hypothetical protein
MKIEVKRNYGIYLIFKADNVLVEEDIEERIYSKLENGKTDFSKPPLRCVATESLDQIVRVLDDMIYYREREYDSNSLISSLIDKLPEESRNELLKKLAKD